MTTGEKPRKVKISSQMQVRIPRELYERYGFGEEAEIFETDMGIELRPVKTDVEKCGDVLEQLVDKGLTGEELLTQFRKQTSSLTEKIEYGATKL